MKNGFKKNHQLGLIYFVARKQYFPHTYKCAGKKQQIQIYNIKLNLKKYWARSFHKA